MNTNSFVAGNTESSVRKDRAFMRKLSIVILYMLLGPPIGSVLLLTVGFFSVLLGGDFLGNASELFQDFMLIFVAGIFYSYFIGGAQAFLTGVLISVVSKDGKFGFKAAAVAPLFVGALAGVAIASDFGKTLPILDTGSIGVAAMLAVIGVAASLILRFLFRKRFAPAGSQS